MPVPKEHSRSEYRQYEKLVSNIKKVYPYALIVRAKLDEVNEELKNIPDERDRKKYLKNVEKDVFAEYQDDIENMTISQGRLLIKLIDRETQNTSYTLIREYRGKFSAAFWQSVARIFGTNLKDEYDPYGEDALIEAIIKEIDAGQIVKCKPQVNMKRIFIAVKIDAGRYSSENDFSLQDRSEG